MKRGNGALLSFIVVARLDRGGSPLIVVRSINREEAVGRRFAVSHAARNVRHPRRTGSSIDFCPANDVLSFGLALARDLFSTSASTFHDTRARRSGRFVAESSPSHVERSPASTESRARSGISRDGDGARRDSRRPRRDPPRGTVSSFHRTRGTRGTSATSESFASSVRRLIRADAPPWKRQGAGSLSLSVAESPGVAVAHVRRTHSRNGGSRCGNAQSQAPFR